MCHIVKHDIVKTEFWVLIVASTGVKGGIRCYRNHDSCRSSFLNFTVATTHFELNFFFICSTVVTTYVKLCFTVVTTRLQLFYAPSDELRRIGFTVATTYVKWDFCFTVNTTRTAVHPRSWNLVRTSPARPWRGLRWRWYISNEKFFKNAEM